MSAVENSIPARFTGSQAFAWLPGLCITMGLAFCLRMLEWPCWQNPEYQFGDEMLLATHDAYHWLSGACGFGRAVGHPMSTMLAGLAGISDFSPAQIAFWIPAVSGAFVAAMVFLWCRLFGCGAVGIAAGLIASISPGFLGRTLLGFYDTDIVTLLFPLVVALPPAIWITGATSGASVWMQLKKRAVIFSDVNAHSDRMAFALALGGLMGWWAQEWHSVFPYLVRYDVFVLFVFALCAVGRRSSAFAMALCFALPAVLGVYGLAWPLLLLGPARFLPKWATGKWLICVLVVVVAFFLARGDIFNTLVNHINAYLKHAGESHSSGAASLIFPSVAQSIIEVQDLSFLALFPYFHPWLEVSVLGFFGFLLVVWKKPAMLLLLPLAALGLLAARMGGRMVMFGAPIVAIGICLPFFWFIRRVFSRWSGVGVCAWASCLLLCASLVVPFLDMIPALSQGPAINRRHAEALAQAGAITPRDSILWLWWDWGYAAHYFARRQTIADGALHGGPSLYLPAAVFATSNPRFARQIIRRASLDGNEPGKFFQDLDQQGAEALMQKLRAHETPLVKGIGRQYLVVSFEMLKLGFWISNFGNWNFITCHGEGGALSIVPEAVSYRLNAGEVKLDGKPGIIFPASINIFAETGVQSRNYVEAWFASHPAATPAEQRAWLASRRNVNFLFNRVTDEKLAVDQGIYDSLMVQLLLCDANDSRFSPYFRLVYDNVFARVYEVLPMAEKLEQ